MTQTYNIIIEKSEDGYYAECPSIVGVYAQGDTETEVLENIKDVLQMTLDDIKEKGEKYPRVRSFPQRCYKITRRKQLYIF
jgi:predicted RNase H-like HicB family nuclease